MSEWKKVKLKDCCIKIGSGSTPKGGSMVYVNSGTSLIRSQNVYNLSFDYNGLTHITEDAANKLKGVTVFNEDILLNITGDSVARTCIVPKEVLPARVNQHVAIIRTDRKKMNWRFLNYYLASPKMQAHMLSLAVGKGASRNALTRQMIENFEVPYPPLSTQHRIATILSRYDSLIENYQKQIKLLEEAAQRLYKEWFVDLRFPGHENTKIVDGVPEGWEKKKLCEFTGITDGTHDSPKQVEIGLPLVTGRCIVDGSIDFSQAYNISEEDVIKINKRSAVEDGDILLSNIGTIGKVCRISKSGNYAVKNMIIFKPHDAIHSCFLHRFLTDNNTQMDFLQQAAGTSQKFVSLSFIRNTLILRPSDTILNLFYNHSEKYFNYVQILQSQLRLLTEARDRLLPKLMSGEIEI